MYIASNEDSTFFQWLFSFGGIFTILIMAGLVWWILRIFDRIKAKREQSNQDSGLTPVDQVPKEDLIKGEEPLPPNAISSTSGTTIKEKATEEFKVEEECEFVDHDGDGIYEKDCTKELIEDDVLFDDVIIDKIDEEKPLHIEKEDKE